MDDFASNTKHRFIQSTDSQSTYHQIANDLLNSGYKNIMSSDTKLNNNSNYISLLYGKNISDGVIQLITGQSKITIFDRVTPVNITINIINARDDNVVNIDKTIEKSCAFTVSKYLKLEEMFTSEEIKLLNT
jgi:hypothetical protein